jgi:uncharacterized protein (DUF302 family)
MKFGFSRTVELPFDRAIERVTEELLKEGFGVLTKIDVQETFKKKLGADYPRYVILGACNPTFAYQALAVDEQIGLLLPCNVIVYDHEGATEVAAFDPRVITTLHDREEIEPIAREMAKRLERVIAKV